LLSALLAIAVPLPAAVDPHAFAQLSFRQHPGAQLPLDARLIDESGRAVTLQQEIGNRPTLVVLEYLHCSNLCNLVLAGASSSLARAGLMPARDVSLIAVSIDPRDTAADGASAKARYAAEFAPGAAEGIHFLTGAPPEVAKIASVVGFPYRFDRESGQFAHPAGFVVTTSAGRISRYVLGLNPPAPAVKEAVSEASRGDVEPPAHPLLLLCFGYDPDAGTAAYLVMRLVRLVSLGTVLACAALIGFLSLRKRRAA
jgi:protein SCO1/2